MAINSFEQYSLEPYSLSFSKMEKIHQELIIEIDNDPDALELYDELIDVATRYAAIRTSWRCLSKEEKIEKDFSRTSCHNSVIIRLNMLSRYLRMQGKPSAWRDELGYEEDDKYYRKSIGDFACYMVFVNSLCAR